MGGRNLNRASGTTAFSVASKHKEFEEAAATIGVSARAIQKTAGGVEQHVVCLQSGGVIRWPTAYEDGDPIGHVVRSSPMDDEGEEM